MNRDSNGNLGIGLLVGAAIGLVIGILYAPRPGWETREMLSEKGDSALQRSKEMYEKAKQRVRHTKNGGAEAEDLEVEA